PANRDPRHLRSWLRTALLPLVAERLGPSLSDNVVRLGEAAASERRAWQSVLNLVPELDLHVFRGGFDVAREGLARYDESLAVALESGGRARAGGARRLDHVDRGHRLGSAPAASRGPGAPARGRRSSPRAAPLDGSARAAERPGHVPGGRPRRHYSVGPGNLP